MNYTEQLTKLQNSHPALAESIAELRNLESILDWIPQIGLSLASVDLVQQDEYNYDFLIPMVEFGICLSFGLT